MGGENTTHELLRRRSASDAALAPLALLWRQTHQLSHPGASSAFVRSFSPAPRFASTAVRVPEEFLKYDRWRRTRACTSFRGSTHCAIEWDEWVMATALLSPAHTVLELGARYGTTSCVLAAATNNSGHVVSVEPDVSVYDDLLHNRDSHACNFHVALGTLGPKRQRINPRYMSGYGRTTQGVSADELASDSFDFRELERRIGGRFNAALVDCEGCIDGVLESGLLAQLELLLMEEDGEYRTSSAHRQAYSRVHDELRRNGFERVWHSHDTAAPGQAWSERIEHSAWTRGVTSESNVLCHQAAARYQYSAAQLKCF